MDCINKAFTKRSGIATSLLPISLRCIILFILLTCFPGFSDDFFMLSPDYRPKKITIYWAGWDEEREHTDYEYNKKGQLVKASVYRGGETPSWYDTFEYDKENNLIKKSTHSSSGLSSYTRYIYINDKLYEEAELDKEGNYTRLVLHEYDKKGNLFSLSVKQVPYNQKYLSWNSLDFFTYDSKQRLSSKIEYYDGTLYNRSFYEYKENGIDITILGYGDLRDVISKTIKSFVYIEKGYNKGKLKELVNNSINIYDDEEHVECCTAYSMKPEYGPKGNMISLSFFNCEKELSGSVVIIWEKGKTDIRLIHKIFDQIHWHFIGC